MTTQRKFYLHTFFWAVLMLLAISGMLMSFIFLLFDEPQEEKRSLSIAALLTCSLAFTASLHRILKAEQLWKRQSISKIMNNPAKILAKWEYPVQQWQEFKKLDLKERRKHPIIATAVILGFAILGFTIAYFGAEEKNGNLIGLAIIVALILGYMVWGFTQNNVKQLKQAYEKQKPGRIILAPEGAIINGEYLIPFEYQGGQLMQVQKVDYHDIPSLQFTVRIRTGTSNAFYQYHIPVPEGRDFEGSWVRQQYEKRLKAL